MSECRHGLDDRWCSICKGTAPPVTLVTIEATFAAKFDGHCPGCDLPIIAGQTIHKLSNDRYVHEGCE